MLIPTTITANGKFVTSTDLTQDQLDQLIDLMNQLQNENE